MYSFIVLVEKDSWKEPHGARYVQISSTDAPGLVDAPIFTCTLFEAHRWYLRDLHAVGDLTRYWRKYNKTPCVRYAELVPILIKELANFRIEVRQLHFERIQMPNFELKGLDPLDG